MADYTFHVLHNARPQYEADTLIILQDGKESTYQDILASGRKMGLTVGSQVKTERVVKDILQLLRDLDLIERRRIKLTERGYIASRIASEHLDLFADVIHYLYYSTWDNNHETKNCFSWSYRFVCDYLWERSHFTIDSKALASQLASEAELRFHVGDVSVSANSINGVLVWLDVLNPGVISLDTATQHRTFSQRHFCPPELLVCSLDLIYREQRLDYGTNLLLSDERRDQICRTCLLNPLGFERVLDYAIAQFDFLEKGIGGGWGRYLTLKKAPQLEDFV